MHALTVLYHEPTNPEGFESHYEQYHMPLVRTYPGLRAIRMTRYQRDPTGKAPPFFLKAEMLFDDEASLNRALGSEQGRAIHEDYLAMSDKYGIAVSMAIGQEEEIA